MGSHVKEAALGAGPRGRQLGTVLVRVEHPTVQRRVFDIKFDIKFGIKHLINVDLGTVSLSLSAAGNSCMIELSLRLN